MVSRSQSPVSERFQTSLGKIWTNEVIENKLFDFSDPAVRALYPPLPRDFYLQDTLAAARALLNCLLIYDSPAGTLVGRITETEGYTRDDPACHAYRGETVRNAAMFGPPGHAYIYLSYGIHYCFNAVTAPAGTAEAVLIRALEPLAGMELMRSNRGLPETAEQTSTELTQLQPARIRLTRGLFLCGGPGKLCRAYGLDRTLDGDDLTNAGRFWIAKPPLELGIAAPYPEQIVATTRIGITRGAELPWRYYLRGETYISRK